MTGRDFLTFAKTLHASDDEAARRSSVSRAYYALYHHVRDCLRSSGIPVTTGPEAHKKMIRYLKNSEIEEAKYVGDQMDDIRKKRNDADYELDNSSFNKNTCASYCRMTEAMFSQLDAVDKQLLRTRLSEYAIRVNEPHNC